MPDCDHVYTLESIENPEGTETGKATARTVWLICTLCSERQARITRRTDAQIQAELDELYPPVE